MDSKQWQLVKIITGATKLQMSWFLTFWKAYKIAYNSYLNITARFQSYLSQLSIITKSVSGKQRAPKT
jgi:hypothetical protein